MGESKKNETYIEANYQSITIVAEENNLNFIFHKYISEHKSELTDNVPDVEFLRKIGAMSGESFYDELSYQIFDYNVEDPIYIVRRFNETFLIGWVYDRRTADKFPFQAFRPLDYIVIGENVNFKASSRPKAELLGEITHPATHVESFFKAIYQCQGCNYVGEIYIQNDYDLFNIGTNDEECNFYKQEKDLLSSGDLIYRKDWPEPDDDPWQMQCAYLPEDKEYCKECEVNHKLDYRSLTVSCPQCDGVMAYNGA